VAGRRLALRVDDGKVLFVHSRAGGVHVPQEPGGRHADMQLDTAFESDRGSLHRQLRLFRLPFSRLRDQEDLRDHADRGGGEGTRLHAGRTDVRGRDADEIAAQYEDQAACGGRRSQSAFWNRVYVRCRRHAASFESKSGIVRSEAYDANGMLSKSNASCCGKKTPGKSGRIRTNGRCDCLTQLYCLIKFYGLIKLYGG